ncbi:MAG: sugar transferase [Candidatus Taylorbacteria bacterium]|nr:sugar transferase [Candidatus Taylorbacteria bacterium]
MSILNRKESMVLGLGDILIFLFALWLMLVLRYGAALDRGIFYAHLAPFSLLVVVWLAVFFIAGLYEKHTLLLRSRLPTIVFQAALANSFLAVIFFYFIPYFGIAPKINLFLYLLLSSALILYWRMYGYRLLYARKKQNAISIGTGGELAELVLEVNRNERYNIRFVASVEINSLNPVDFRKNILSRIEADEVTLVAVDLQNKKIEPILPYLYGLIFKNIQFVDIHQLYEEIFDRIPLSLITYDWFLEHISVLPSAGYDALKRLMDITLSSVLGLTSLLFYPFIIAAIKLDDGGPIFIFQERVGAKGVTVRTIKFRTMTRDDAGIARDASGNKPTRVGLFLRQSRLDELPQFWNVLKGDLSLIGPRPELPSLVAVYEREVPYYNVRHLIKPGLSGWAQLYHDKHPHHRINVNETRVKLSYDLYYIKNRSFFLDLKIALKTLKTLLSRSGV